MSCVMGSFKVLEKSQDPWLINLVRTIILYRSKTILQNQVVLENLSQKCEPLIQNHWHFLCYVIFLPHVKVESKFIFGSKHQTCIIWNCDPFSVYLHYEESPHICKKVIFFFIHTFRSCVLIIKPYYKFPFLEN